MAAVADRAEVQFRFPEKRWVPRGVASGSERSQMMHRLIDAVVELDSGRMMEVLKAAEWRVEDARTWSLMIEQTKERAVAFAYRWRNGGEDKARSKFSYADFIVYKQLMESCIAQRVDTELTPDNCMELLRVRNDMLAKLQQILNRYSGHPADVGGVKRKEWEQKFKVMRMEKGFAKQADLVAATGILQPYLSDIERGFRLPDLNEAEKIAAALDVPREELFLKTTEKRVRKSKTTE